MELKLKYGLFGLCKAKFIFDLAALKAATVAARMDLGEFFTSEKLSDDDRLYFHVYGAWLKGRPVSIKTLKKFDNFYKNLNVKQINDIKLAKFHSEIISKEFREGLTKFAESKKKT
jgi:hypothetical protein